MGLLLRCRVYDAVQSAAAAAAAPGQGPAAVGAPTTVGGRLYSLQQACLFHVASAPAAGSANSSSGGSAHSGGQPLAQAQPALRQGGGGVAGAGGLAAPPLRLQWQGFVDMPGGGNRFTAK